MKPCAKSMSRIPQGNWSFPEREKLIAISRKNFKCLSAPSSDANNLMIPKNACNLPQVDLTIFYTYVLQISNHWRSDCASDTVWHQQPRNTIDIYNSSTLCHKTENIRALSPIKTKPHLCQIHMSQIWHIVDKYLINKYRRRLLRPLITALIYFF